jgi:NADPH-dependent ferric siderophore reductase
MRETPRRTRVARVVGPEVELVWVHREDREPGTALPAAELPAGTVHAFLHGEAGFVRALRRHLRADRMLVPDLTSISGCRRRGRTEDRWRAEKPEWNAAIAAEERTVTAG